MLAFANVLKPLGRLTDGFLLEYDLRGDTFKPPGFRSLLPMLITHERLLTDSFAESTDYFQRFENLSAWRQLVEDANKVSLQCHQT